MEGTGEPGVRGHEEQGEATEAASEAVSESNGLDSVGEAEAGRMAE